MKKKGFICFLLIFSNLNKKKREKEEISNIKFFFSFQYNDIINNT